MLPPPTSYQSLMRGWVLRLGLRAGVEASRARAAEECREVIVSACFRSATSIRSVRRVASDAVEGAGIHVARVVRHQASLRVGGDVALVFGRADVDLGADAGPVRSLRGFARVLVGDGGDRRAVGRVELGEALVGLLDGGGGADFGVLRGGVHVCRGADGCDGHKGDRESEFADVRFHGRYQDSGINSLAERGFKSSATKSIFS